MNIRNLIRCLVLVAVFASMAGALSACHTSPHRTWNKTFHNR